MPDDDNDDDDDATAPDSENDGDKDGYDNTGDNMTMLASRPLQMHWQCFWSSALVRDYVQGHEQNRPLASIIEQNQARLNWSQVASGSQAHVPTHAEVCL